MRIVLVEDQLLMREALRKACTRDLRYHVLAESGDGQEGLSLILRHKPDVVLLDLCLPQLDGFSIIEEVRRAAPAIKFIVVTAYLDDFTIYQLGQLGVEGFVDKATNQIAAIEAALRALAAGRTYYSQAFAAARQERLRDPSWFTRLLSQAELAVLSLIGRAMDNSEIGARLGISPRTAQKHRSNILKKLRVRGTPKLMMFAQERGFTERTASRPSFDT